MKRAAAAACLVSLSACVSTPRAVAPKLAWADRLVELQSAQRWNLDGRAAVALASQGWQASLQWRQRGESADVSLAGPFGVGKLAFHLSPDGVQMTTPESAGATPESSAAAQDPQGYLRERLGFAPPLEELRYWLLGVPSPGSPFDLRRNAVDRASRLVQDGWEIDYPQYAPVGGDSLPHRLSLQRGEVRLRIAVDRWDLSP